MPPRALTALAAASLFAAAAPAVAQTDDGGDGELGVTAVVERPLASGSELDPTAAATVVETEDRARALETVDELLLEVPGAQARHFGGPGSFTAVSMRGAEPEHTAVLLGEVPIDPMQGGAFDLSTVPVTLLDGVEVYRGGAPLWLGSGAIGGVLRLVPLSAPEGAEPRRARLTLGVGSFGLRSVDAATSIRAEGRGPALATAVGVTHADGDFPFVHPGTSLDPDDDRELRRTNNVLDEARGLIWLQVPAAGGTAEAVLLGYGRTGGEPGTGLRPAARAHRSLTHALGALSWEIADAPSPSLGDRPPLRLKVTGSVGHGRSRVSDLLRETGLTQRATDDRTLRVAGRVAGEWEAARWLGVTALLSLGHERYTPQDALAAQPVSPSERLTAAAGAEVRLRPRVLGLRSELRGSARLEVTSARLVDTRAPTLGVADEVTRVAPTGRLAAVLEPAAGISLGVSAAAGSRAPTFGELFGDRAFLIGNPNLSRERSLSADASTVARGRIGKLGGAAELRLFSLFADRLIRYRANNQGQGLPENVRSARIVGVELGARGRWGRHLGLTTAATWMAPEDLSSDPRDLPLRPRLSAYARPELRLHAMGPLTEITFFGEVTHLSKSFTDPTNLVAFDARTHLGAGFSFGLLRGRLLVALTARDLLDARGEDVLGFPLPGRSFAFTTTLRTEASP